MSGVEFFSKTSNHSAPLQPRFGALWLLAFPKLKSPFKSKRFQIIEDIQENMMGQLMMIRRTAWGPKVPTLKGTEVSSSWVQCFFYLLSSLVNVSIFILHCWIPSGPTLYVCVHTHVICDVIHLAQILILFKTWKVYFRVAVCVS